VKGYGRRLVSGYARLRPNRAGRTKTRDGGLGASLDILYRPHVFFFIFVTVRHYVVLLLYRVDSTALAQRSATGGTIHCMLHCITRQEVGVTDRRDTKLTGEKKG
jgi:hypothetical protein